MRLRVCAQLTYVCFKSRQAAACVPSAALSFYPGRSAGMFDLSAGPSRLCFFTWVSDAGVSLLQGGND